MGTITLRLEQMKKTLPQTEPEPIGFQSYHITFTTYGSWLLGTCRGSTRHGGAKVRPCDRLEGWMRERCAYAEVTLTEEMRQIVFDAILQVAEYYRWHIRIHNVLAQHVHVLISAPATTRSSVILAKLKTGATKALRSAGYFKDRPVWTSSGDARPIRTREYFEKVCDYIHNEQTHTPFDR